MPRWQASSICCLSDRGYAVSAVTEQRTRMCTSRSRLTGAPTRSTVTGDLPFLTNSCMTSAHFRWSATVKQITASAGSAHISNNIVNHNLHNQCPSVWIVTVEFFTPAASLCCSLMPVIRVLIKRTRHSNDLWPLVGRIAGVSRPFWIDSTQAQLRLAVGE